MANIIFAGDVIIADSCFDLGFGVIEKAQKEGNFDFIKDMAGAFLSSDLSVANLEFVISDETPFSGNKSRIFRAPTASLNAIKELGIDVFSVANNHIMGHGQVGFDNTISALAKIDANVIGLAKKPYFIHNIKNIKLGIIGASAKYDSNVHNPKDYYLNIYPPSILSKHEFLVIYESIQNEADRNFWKEVYKLEHNSYVLDIIKIRSELKNEINLYNIITSAYCNGIIKNSLFDCLSNIKKQCDFIVVYMHWGDEYIHIPANWQIELGHRLVDIGAQLVIGCHSHVIQGIEMYKNTPIVYSLGNFYFNSINPKEMQGIILELELAKKANYISTNYKTILYQFNPQKMSSEKCNEKLQNDFSVQFEYYSKQIGKLNQNEYWKKISEGLAKSRRYKRKYLLMNWYKINLFMMIQIGWDFLHRKLELITGGKNS